MEFIINQVRREFYPNGTTGRLYVPNFNPEKSVYTCEDANSPNGLKLDGETCIPDGVYQYEISYSPTFKRDLPLLYNNDVKELVMFGKVWKGIRMHVGNTPANSLGCILVGYGLTKGVAAITESQVCENDLVAHLKAHAPKGLWIISSIYPR